MKFKDYKNKILNSDENFSKSYYDKRIDFEFEIANLITEARLYKGFTQKELAQLLKTQQPSIARLEKGETLPSLTFLKKIADSLGTYLTVKFGFMEQGIKVSINREPTSQITELFPSPYYKLRYSMK